MRTAGKRLAMGTLGLVLTAALVSPAFGQDVTGEKATTQPVAAPAQTPETVLATVDGKQLTRGQLDTLKKYLAPGAPAAQEQRLIDFWKLSTVLAEQAREAKLDSDPEVVLVVDMLKNKFMGDLYVRKQQMDIEISDADLKAHYDANQNKPEFRKGFFLTADVIAAEKREQIVQTKKELMDGKDFNEVFEAHKAQTMKLTGLSDPSIKNVSSKLLVGNLGQGVVSAMTMVKEGEIIGPRKAPKAWVLFKITERKPGDLIPFEDVKEDIRGKMEREKKMKIGREIMEKAQKKAGIAPPMPRRPRPMPQKPQKPMTKPVNKAPKK